MARLITIGSSSVGNAYAVEAGGVILLLEAGRKMSEVKRAINYRMSDVVGCVATHAHGDHSKYITDYAKQGIKVYCNSDVEAKKEFPYGSCQIIEHGETYKIGEFSVVPFDLYHDVPSLGFLVHHDDFGNLVFITDTYKMDFSMTGVDHWLIEANYDDRILKANVEDGKIDRAQANRLMLSHMSINNTIHYLQDCEVQKFAKTITLCHLSERNSDAEMFRDRVAKEFGVPTFVASKGMIVELNKENV